MRQTCVALVAIVALLMFASTAWSQNPTFIRGDVNANGIVDAADQAELAAYVGGGSVACPLAADANDDGIVNFVDPTYLGSFLTGGPPPPPPYPDCGEDPTNPQPGTSCCEPPPPKVPSMTMYGAGVLILLLMVTAVWVWRKKQVSVHA